MLYVQHEVAWYEGSVRSDRWTHHRRPACPSSYINSGKWCEILLRQNWKSHTTRHPHMCELWQHIRTVMVQIADSTARTSRRIIRFYFINPFFFTFCRTSSMWWELVYSACGEWKQQQGEVKVLLNYNHLWARVCWQHSFTLNVSKQYLISCINVAWYTCRREITLL